MNWAGQRAVISPCEKYRYWLSRHIGGSGPPVGFIMLNPSTADAEIDDPTIRRCMGFAQAWDHSELIVVNLFALRATNPKHLKTTPAPIGPDNDEAIQAALGHCDLLVAAWGAHGRYKNRGDNVRRKTRQQGHVLHFLKLTGKGDPSHPLYLKSDLTPKVWGEQPR